MLDRSQPTSRKRPDRGKCRHGVELLEGRRLLASHSALLTEFVLFAQQKVDLDKNVTIFEGVVGSNDEVKVDKDSSTEGLAGGGSLELQETVYVDGDVLFNGEVEIKKKSVVNGHVDGGQKVTLKEDVTVFGDVVSAGEVSLDAGAAVLGTITEFGLPDFFTSIDLPEPTSFTTDPDNDIATSKEETITLLPGAYGDLQLRKENVLRLSSGEYFFDKIDVDKDLDLEMDLSLGEIAIFVTGKVQFGESLEVTLVNGGAENVYLETHDQFELKKESQWFGTIFAPQDKIDLNENLHMEGAAYSGTEIKVAKDSQVHFQPANRLRGNSPPIAQNDAVTTSEDQLLQGDVLADNSNGADGDPDGDSLAVTRVNGATANVGTQISLGSGALLTVNANGTFSYDPNGRYEQLHELNTATDTFDYQISDGNGGFGSATVTVTVSGVNDPPVAQDVAGSAIEDGPAVTLSFDADDVDGDNDPSTLTYEMLGTLSEGSVVNNNDGTFTFDPGNDFQDLAATETRTVNFAYRATDSNSAVSNTATATITVTGVNDLPVVIDQLAVVDDTGSSDVDQVTSRASVAGVVSPATAATTVQASIDAGPRIDLLVDAAGSFTFDPGLANDGTDDGVHTIAITATNVDGFETNRSITFTLDTIVPSPPTFDLDPAFDTAPLGDLETGVETVEIIGQTDPNVEVTLLALAASTVSDGSGSFRLTDIPLALGENLFVVQATDLAGNRNSFSQTIVRTDVDAPTITADLLNDTAPGGSTNGDGITFDPTISGVVSDNVEVVSLGAQLDGGSLESVEFDAQGNFTFLPDLATDGSEDGPHTIQLRAIDGSGNESNKTISLVLDSVPPNQAPFGLDASSRLEPANPALTTLSVVSLTGQSDPNQVVTLLQNGAATTAGGDGSFIFTNVAVSDGLNPLTTSVFDVAGNEADFSLSVSKVSTPPTPGSNDSIVLSEGSNWLTEHAILIDLGQAEGSRRLRFDVAASFDTTDANVLVGDLLQVYLVDPFNPGTTLLDRGREGEALFSLGETGADFLPGLVTYDGTTVTVDLTSLADQTQGVLIFQAINGDQDNGTVTTITDFINELDEEGVASPAFFSNTLLAEPGAAVDLNAYSVVSDGSIGVSVENIRVDGEAGRYLADVSLRNTGDLVSRALALRFNDLPTGVELIQASGSDAFGAPFINLAPAVTSGGLDTGAITMTVEVAISNPDRNRFELDVDVLSAGPNRTPIFEAITDVTVMPGDVANLTLQATDEDGDHVTFSVPNAGELPNNRLAGSTLSFSPSPDQLGVYPVTVLAKDGASTAQRQFMLNVVADPITTTRLSGQVLDSNGVTPLAGVPVEVNGATTLTDAAGRFTLETPGLTGDDAVKVRADEANIAGKTYPFVAEKIHLVLADGPFPHVNNVIARPIFLPALDVAGGTNVDSATDTTVAQEIAPGETAEVFVAAGSLLMDDGAGGLAPFDGVLSITEVPRDFTPAALPPDLLPDVVVTIQPGEMIFSVPAPLTLPNRAGQDPGTIMDLWSINPITGQFDQVGIGQVSADGSVVETTSGGIRNSSWHLFVPGPEELPDPNFNDENPNDTCEECKAKQKLTSEVELHSGALLETHDLAPYTSLGVTRGLTLHYDSDRADPRPIIHFGANNIVSRGNDRVLIATLEFTRGSFADFRGANWGIDFGVNDLLVALQGDLRDQPSGIYDYTLRRGAARIRPGEVDRQLVFVAAAARLSPTTGQVVHVNEINSAFGSGWQLGGLQQVIENPDGSILLIDGDGTDLVFNKPLSEAAAFESPAGDFSALVKNADGTYTRRLKDQTTFQFDETGRLTSIIDRHGNVTQHVYEFDRLTRIIDPTGLETTFTYSGDRVTEITDPAGRTTTLDYDVDGNLSQITDPDSSTRTFEYDNAHHLIAETNQRGHREESLYGFHGRVTGGVLRDGTELVVNPVQTRVLLPLLTSGPLDGGFLSLPRATSAPAQTVAQMSDGRGNVTVTVLDQSGQAVSASDAVGPLPTVARNADNLITSTTDGRGNTTEYIYDDRGNVTSVADEIVRAGAAGSLFPGAKFAAGSSPYFVTTADFNGDGVTDVVSAWTFNDGARSTHAVSVLLGRGDGTFDDQRQFAVGNSSSRFGFATSVTTGDFNGDGATDLATSNNGNTVSVLLGDGQGSFGIQQVFNAGTTPASITAQDFNGDGVTDLATANSGSNDISVLLGQGDGTFGAPQSFTVATSPKSITAGDFNGDGLPDLVTANSGSNDVSVLLGQGDGSFVASQPFATEGTSPNSVATEDVNGDGVTDVVTANSDSNDISVLLGQGDGTLGAPQMFATGNNPQSVTAGDFNSDGVPDLATADLDSNAVSVLLGQGDGTFAAPQPFATGDEPASLTTGDFNGDGLDDLAMANSGIYANDVSVLLGQGDGTFGTPLSFTAGGTVGSSPVAATTGDFNGDGLTDLATANYSGSNSLSVLLGQGDGTFSAQQFFTAGSRPRSVTTGDFNGDGVTDLAAANRLSNDVSVLLGQGDGTFGAQLRYTVGKFPESVTTGEFNGDGLTDLAVANAYRTNDVSVLLGQGDGTFSTQLRFPAGSIPRSVAAADFNGDGVTDLVTSNTGTNVSVLWGQGDGTFTAPQGFEAGNVPQSVAASDFNGDGVTDIAVANRYSETVSVLLGRGDGTFEAPQAFDVGSTPESLSSADFNGDGVTDLVTGNLSSNDVSVLLGQGDGTFDAERRFHAGGAPTVTTADFNGDGVTDLATANRTSHDVSVLLGTGGTQAQPLTFTYDAVFNQLTSITDELGRVMLFEVDPANGNRLSTTQVVGAVDDPGNGETDDLVTTFSYTPQGLVDLETDPLGRVTDFEYDGLGRLVRTTFAIGTADEAFQLFEYDAAGNQTAVVDENGNRTEFEYDALNRLTRVIEADPDGTGPLTSPITSFRYDARGNRIATTDAANSTTTNEYDARDRLVLTRDDLANESTFQYDPDGNLISATDPNGNVSRITYDSRNRVLTSIDPEGGITTFRYGVDDNLLFLTDPNGNRTRFAYDARDRLVREEDALGAELLYRYDAADNLTKKADRNRRVTEFVYDELDRLTREVWLNPDNSITNAIEYLYDKGDNLLQIAGSGSTLAYSYDARDRVISVDNSGTQGERGLPNVVLNYTYDDIGNVVGLSEAIDQVPGASTQFAYDGLDRMRSTQQTGPGVAEKLVDFVYNELGQFKEVTRFSEVSRSSLVAATFFNLDELDRLEALNHGTSSNLRDLAFYDFEYDAAGRITALTDTDGRTGYSYDDRNQLTVASRGAADTRNDESYTYDANGNRVESHLHANGYVTRGANRLVSDGTLNYEYDPEGNITRSTVVATGEFRELQYDHRNRLIRVTDRSPGGTIRQDVSFVYDSINRRIGKIVDVDGDGPRGESMTHFVYDRENVLLEIVDADGSAIPPQPQLRTRYLFGPDVDQVLAQEDVVLQETQWLLTDHLGSVRDIVNSAGTVVNHITYDSFGNILSVSNPLVMTRYGFTGREFDREIDLQYNRARYYAATVGRFVSEDPIRIAGGDANFYRYVVNSPAVFADPTGLAPKKKNPLFKDNGENIYILVCMIQNWVLGNPACCELPYFESTCFPPDDEDCPNAPPPPPSDPTIPPPLNPSPKPFPQV